MTNNFNTTCDTISKLIDLTPETRQQFILLNPDFFTRFVANFAPLLTEFQNTPVNSQKASMDIVVYSPPNRLNNNNTIDEKTCTPNTHHEKSPYRNSSGYHFKRLGLANLGNTCYLNATLQVLRNSLVLTCETAYNSHFTNILMDFYMGEGKCVPNAIVDYLENKFQVNLRVQSDAVTYLEKICRILEEETSHNVLEKIKLTLTSVEWTCCMCHLKTTDTRALKPSYSLILSDSYYKQNLAEYIMSALKFSRKKNCKRCERQTDHDGVRTFLPNKGSHLVLVPQIPKTMNLKLDMNLMLENCKFKLIASVLHKGGYYGIRGGHYIAIVVDGVNGKDVWYECNDSHVAPVTTSRLGAYHLDYTPTILIYERKS